MVDVIFDLDRDGAHRAAVLQTAHALQYPVLLGPGATFVVTVPDALAAYEFGLAVAAILLGRGVSTSGGRYV